jgi:hypothetical protein
MAKTVEKAIVSADKRSDCHKMDRRFNKCHINLKYFLLFAD